MTFAAAVFHPLAELGVVFHQAQSSLQIAPMRKIWPGSRPGLPGHRSSPRGGPAVAKAPGPLPASPADHPGPGKAPKPRFQARFPLESAPSSSFSAGIRPRSLPSISFLLESTLSVCASGLSLREAFSLRRFRLRAALELSGSMFAYGAAAIRASRFPLPRSFESRSPSSYHYLGCMRTRYGCAARMHPLRPLYPAVESSLVKRRARRDRLPLARFAHWWPPHKSRLLASEPCIGL